VTNNKPRKEKMPNKLKEGTLRVSYVESQVNNKAVALLAGLKSVTISAVIREAVIKLLEVEDPSGEIRATAKELIQRQSDSADERLQTKLDDKILERLKKLAALKK
jgi:hypothetical protein